MKLSHILGFHSLIILLSARLASSAELWLFCGITGLDPAGPLFDGPLSLDGLNPSRAEFVDVLHTDPGVYGTKEQLGQVDIWFNCACKIQPQCNNASIIVKVFLLSVSLGHSADLQIYCGSLTNYTSTELENPLPLLTNTCFDENRLSVFYAHGLNDSPDESTAQEIFASFIALLYNVFAIDWSKEASTGVVLLTPVLYPATAVPNAIKVGNLCGDAINVMTDSTLNIGITKVVGHSLGSHVAGYCGKRLRTYGKEIPKPVVFFVALDGLDKTSGNCVIAHHTNPGVLGTFEQVGHKDIWYNCNKKYQPKCDGEPLFRKDTCSHVVSCDYYAEAIANPTNFAAVPSSSCNEWQTMGAATAAYIYINDNTNCTGDNGNFYLSTNGQSPYGKSLDGIYPDNDSSVSVDNAL